METVGSFSRCLYLASVACATDRVAKASTESTATSDVVQLRTHSLFLDCCNFSIIFTLVVLLPPTPRQPLVEPFRAKQRQDIRRSDLLEDCRCRSDLFCFALAYE